MGGTVKRTEKQRRISRVLNKGLEAVERDLRLSPSHSAGLRRLGQRTLDTTTPVSISEAEDMVGTLRDFAEGWAVCEEAEKSLSSEKPPGEPLPPAMKRGLYQGPLEERVQVLEFVTDRVVPFVSLEAGSFDTRGKNISWRQLADEWNRLHPDPPVTPEALKHQYYDARADTYTREVYRYRLQQDVRTAVREVRLAVLPVRGAKVFVPLSDLEKSARRFPDRFSLPREILRLLPETAKKSRGRGWRGAQRWLRRFYQRASHRLVLTYRFWLWALFSASLNEADSRSSRYSQQDMARLVGPLRPM